MIGMVWTLLFPMEEGKSIDLRFLTSGDRVSHLANTENTLEIEEAKDMEILLSLS
jgi:hypothetical protein